MPLGGYVRIAGMAPGDGTAADDPESFANHPAWQRFLVILAGPAVNWAFAVLLLATLFVVGVRVSTNRPVVEDVSGAAAAAAGLMPGDRIVSIDDQPIGTWEDVERAIGARRGKLMQIRVARGGGEQTLTGTTGPDGRLGIGGETQVARLPLKRSFSLALAKSGQGLLETLDLLRRLVLRKGDTGPVIGPVEIVSETVQAVSKDVSQIFLILGQISLVLAMMNLLPIPALDGGRLAFILVAMVRRRPVNPSVEAAVHGAGLVLLLLLMVFVTYRDVRRRLHASEASGRAPPAAAASSADAGP